ncbi:MAG: patatin-like phospholipase family protein [Actinobacteria bacterium]|nr:MAG: patatin-like phospholipase family protein [Actinomycetota bacterium]
MKLGRYVRPLRTVRARKRPHVAFVLSGGGVLGAVQVGQLRALIEAGIVPDVLIGTSVGALNAAAVAADPTPAGVDLLADVWLSLHGDDLFPGTRVQRALHFVRKGDHLYSNDGISALVRKLRVRSFEEMQKPLSIVAANLRTGAEHVFESGPIAPPLIATTALPGIFPPVLIDGELYVDGGIVNNVPISVAVELGARRIYVLTCGAPKPTTLEIRRPLDVLLQAFAHSRAARVDLDLRRFADAADLRFVPPPSPRPIRFNDTSHTQQLMSEGYELTRAFLGQGERAAARA